MTPEQWQQVKTIAKAASELEPARRDQFVAEAAAGDALVQQEVHALLEAFVISRSERVTAPESAIWDRDYGVDPWIGKRIGVYRIDDVLGSGGMGDVYSATRVDQEFQQRVAIKILRGGRNNASMVRRFKSERQILAALEHRNIAKLLDGGTTADGMPYFVMELVEGVPIDAYCDQHKLDVDARLRLFMQVCAAVEYAHRHLVLHRDIKPSNILVTGDGSVKLLDFGIAKVIRPDEESTAGESRPDSTVTVMPVLTPAFCSPEQARGESLTTATDVYSLGAVLYLLLTGHHAHPFKSKSSTTWIEVISNEEPKRPSVVVESPAQAFVSVDARLWQRRLRGDLDSIVLMALRKDPARRYSSAEHLSDDVRRHLDNIPVLARGDEFSYTAGRFVRRHKAGVGAVALIALTLIGGVVATTREAQIANEQRARAERRFSDVRELANSLVKDVSTAIETLPGSTEARKKIAEHARVYLEKLARESEADPDLMVELARAYRSLAQVQGDGSFANLGDVTGAEQSNLRALTLLLSASKLRPNSPEILMTLLRTCRDANRMRRQQADSQDRLIDECTEGQAQLEALAKQRPTDTKLQMAIGEIWVDESIAFNDRKQFRESLAALTKAKSLYSRLHAADPADASIEQTLAMVHKRVGAVELMLGDLPNAFADYQSALKVDEAWLARKPNNTPYRYAVSVTYSDLGLTLILMGKIDEGIEHYRRSLAIREALAADDPRDAGARARVAMTLGKIGDALVAHRKEYQEGIANYTKASTLYQQLADDKTMTIDRRPQLLGMQAAIGFAYAKWANELKRKDPGRARACVQAQKTLREVLPQWQALSKVKPLENDVQIVSNANQSLEQCAAILKEEGRT